MLQDDNINPASTMLSTPGDPQTSLFEDESSVSPVVAALTPDSLDLDERRYSETPQSTRQHSSQSTPELSDTKKPVKKRKSWGQELPTPKTNLPPRKRAKTEDEKEQRRIERVLRNRAAAQSSRERKRKEVEGLEDEKRNIELNNSTLAVRLTHAQRELRQLREQIVQLEQENSALRKMSLSLQGDIPTPDVSVKSFSPRIPSRLSISECASQIKAENEDPRSTSITPISLYLHPQQSNFFFQTNTDDLPREGPTATTPNLTHKPAVSVGRSKASMGFVKGSRVGGCTTTTKLDSLDGAPGYHVTDSLFDRLFDCHPTSASPHVADFQLFDERCSTSDVGPSPTTGDIFSFDSLVDIDGGDLHDLDDSATNDDHFAHATHHLRLPSCATPTISTLDESLLQLFPEQLAPTTPGLQPSFGAPT